MQPDNLAFIDALARDMNDRPELYERYGAADFVAVLAMRRSADDTFYARLFVDGVKCVAVDEIDADDAATADFCLDGPLDAWQVMFDDIVHHGGATGLHTINSLALMGDHICLVGNDPMGLDKFSRFNQTLQEFFDGAARVVARTTS